MSKKIKLFIATIIVTISAISLSSYNAKQNWLEAKSQAAAATKTLNSKPFYNHIVIVVEENHTSKKIVNNPSAPYINSLMKSGVNLTNHYAIEHPSQPNYLDLFSGSNQGVTNDKVPPKMHTDNLAFELIKHHFTFGGYSEGLPKVGYDGPYSLKTKYARKHNPWSNFTNLPSSISMPLSSFPKDYNQLPTVSFVIPNLDHDMHDGSIKTADDWLKKHMSSYVHWATGHNSLFILTWDEDDMSSNNKIPTVIVGANLKNGVYNTKTNHFTILRTIEEIYGLNFLGKSKNAQPLRIWK
ncbi:alkaline phosphatase family protein [Paenibacillus sediminis]|uniref:Acid phosphatase n=1 Tax=Paenibacillus sediminis TaxID=664909 RepID=A0ABS4H235_9BACL|nr:alkaline phosphatase family protein [Paenibacillus sediminis]MBP1936175.1 hypothetical protein [Paenibacillus sediminis]